jgi:D-beta-D-heptose 7-phosphate kinase/D-beta-D-heptose 1-phosphate adenosyltransferase
MIVSGGFDPIHPGHIEMFREASKFGDIVVAGVNSDNWLRRKKGKEFQRFYDRLLIVNSNQYVNIATGFNDDDGTAIDLIQRTQLMFPTLIPSRFTFCNGGDRGVDNTPESEFCMDQGINVKYAVGGTTKFSSSSVLLDRWVDHANQQ